MNKKLLAVTLGDGYLSSRGCLRITHCEKQLEYLQYKASLFNKENDIHYKNNNSYPAYYFEKGTFNNTDEGQEVRKKLYGVFGKKYFTQDIVDEMNLFCWAILYLDDGSLCAKKRNGKIHAYDLVISIYGSQDECERLIIHLKEKYNLSFTLKYNKGKYSIRCGTREARKFLALIRPLVPDFDCFKDNKMKEI